LKKVLGKVLPDDLLQDPELSERLKIEAIYAHAIEHQAEEVQQLNKESELKFPKHFNFKE